MLGRHNAGFIRFSILITVVLIGGFYIFLSIGNAADSSSTRRNVATVAQGLIKGENSFYRRHGHYSLNPRRDIYPAYPALAALMNKKSIKVVIREFNLEVRH